jgi:signal transduction histidine kinase
MEQASPYARYQELQRYVGWTEEDARRVQSLEPLVAPHFGQLIDDFYAEIERHPDARRVITGGEQQIARLKQTLKQWLAELFSGRYDRDYVERRWRVGLRHVEIGLDQVYTNAALSRLRSGILTAIESSVPVVDMEMLTIRRSLNTLIDLDLALIEDAYQTEYRRRQSAADRLATIGKMAGGIAHELRNPLNVIKTSVYYIMHAKSAPPEKVQSHLERIERQVGAADRVITALNDFARLPAPQLEPVDLENCLREVLEMNPPGAGVEVELSVRPSTIVVSGDRSQLMIVFGNLIRNARDAMAGGGVLRIDAARDGDFAVVTVEDTGVGIPADVLPHVLEPLYSTKAKGIGLGLSITHDIVRRHGGALSVASTEGRGSTFTVRLKVFSQQS